MHIYLASGGIFQLLLNCTAMMVVKETPLQLKDLDDFTQAQFKGVKNHGWRRLPSNFWQNRCVGSFGPANVLLSSIRAMGPSPRALVCKACARLVTCPPQGTNRESERPEASEMFRLGVRSCFTDSDSFDCMLHNRAPPIFYCFD